MPFYRLLFSATLLLGLGACGSEGAPAKVTDRANVRPLAFGDANRVNILASDAVFDGPLDDTLLYYYEQAYPLMPQPEPIYDVQRLSLKQLESNSARRELRLYVILADLRDASDPVTQFVVEAVGEERVRAAREDPSGGITVSRDRWARDQTLIYIYAEGQDALGELIARSFPTVRKRITEADVPKLRATTYQSDRDEALEDTVFNRLGLKLELPGDTELAEVKDSVVWLRRDLGLVVQNLLLTRVPYTDAEQITAAEAVALRNRMGRKIVRSQTAGSYMTTNDRDLPVLTEAVEIDGAYAFEARGVWEMTDDFMGGPFFTYLIPEPGGNRLWVIDAFVYAPGKEKRNYMQQLETIVRTAEL